MLRMQGLRKPVQAVAFAPDGRALASAGNDAAIHLWEQATGKELASWPAHRHAVLCLAFSPDGRLLASGSFEQIVKVWDVATRQCLVSLRGRPPVATAVAFAPDGKTLAAAYGDRLSFRVEGGVKWWEVGSWKLLDMLSGVVARSATGPDGPAGGGGAAVPTRYGGIQSLAYFADGGTVVLGTAFAGAALWDRAGRRERAAFYQRGCRAVALSPDQRTVAAAEATAVNLWDVESGKKRATLKGHKGAVWSVAYSPDGKLVLSGAKDGEVRLWDAATGAPRGAFNWDVGTVHHVAFAPDGMTAAVAGHTGTVVLWDVEPDEAGGVPVEGVTVPEPPGRRPAGPRRLEHQRPVKALAFSPDGQTLASLAATDCIKLWAPDTGRQRGRVPPGRSRPAGYGMAFLPDGHSLALGTWYVINLDVWDTRTWVVQTKLLDQHFAGAGQPRPRDQIGPVASSPVGRHLALGGRSTRRAPLEVRYAAVADLRATLFLGAGGVSALAFSRDGKRIAVATRLEGIVVWDVDRDRATATVPTERQCLALTFSPDGLRLLGAVRRAVVVWDAQTGAVLATLTGHTDEVRGLALTPDGRTLLSAGKDGTVRVWDVASGAERAALDWKVGILNCVAVAPDGKTAAAGGHSGTVVVWDLDAPAP